VAIGLLKGVALRVAELRRRAGFTQQQLADRAGLRRGYVARVEAKAENLSLSTLNRIAFALEIEPAELLAGLPADPLPDPASPQITKP
jgi:transcriptional regulator with XRE-family HTH domain